MTSHPTRALALVLSLAACLGSAESELGPNGEGKHVHSGLHEDTKPEATPFNKALPADGNAHSIEAFVHSEPEVMEFAQVRALDREMRWSPPRRAECVTEVTFRGDFLADMVKDEGYFSKFNGKMKRDAGDGGGGGGFGDGGEKGGEVDLTWSFLGELKGIECPEISIDVPSEPICQGETFQLSGTVTPASDSVRWGTVPETHMEVLVDATGRLTFRKETAAQPIESENVTVRLEDRETGCFEDAEIPLQPFERPGATTLSPGKPTNECTLGTGLVVGVVNGENPVLRSCGPIEYGFTYRDDNDECLGRYTFAMEIHFTGSASVEAKHFSADIFGISSARISMVGVGKIENDEVFTVGIESKVGKDSFGSVGIGPLSIPIQSTANGAKARLDLDETGFVREQNDQSHPPTEEIDRSSPVSMKFKVKYETSNGGRVFITSQGNFRASIETEPGDVIEFKPRIPAD